MSKHAITLQTLNFMLRRLFNKRDIQIISEIFEIFIDKMARAVYLIAMKEYIKLKLSGK